MTTSSSIVHVNLLRLVTTSIKLLAQRCNLNSVNSFRWSSHCMQTPASSNPPPTVQIRKRAQKENFVYRSATVANMYLTSHHSHESSCDRRYDNDHRVVVVACSHHSHDYACVRCCDNAHIVVVVASSHHIHGSASERCPTMSISWLWWHQATTATIP